MTGDRGRVTGVHQSRRSPVPRPSVYRLSSVVRVIQTSRASTRITDAISIPEGHRTLASNSSQVARVWLSRACGSSRAAARMISPNVRSIPGAIQSLQESQFMHARTPWPVDVMMIARSGTRETNRSHALSPGWTMDGGRWITVSDG